MFYVGKRGIFGIAMLDSQRCILGEVVPPSQEWLSWRLKVATPIIKCCLWWCLFWLLLGRGDNPTYNLNTWICVFDAGKQGKISYPKCWFFLVIYYIPWDPKSVPKITHKTWQPSMWRIVSHFQPEKVVYLQPVREFHHVCMYQVDVEKHEECPEDIIMGT